MVDVIVEVVSLIAFVFVVFGILPWWMFRQPKFCWQCGGRLIAPVTRYNPDTGKPYHPYQKLTCPACGLEGQGPG